VQVPKSATFFDVGEADSDSYLVSLPGVKISLSPNTLRLLLLLLLLLLSSAIPLAMQDPGVSTYKFELAPASIRQYLPLRVERSLEHARLSQTRDALNR